MATRKQKEKNINKVGDETPVREIPLRQSPRKRGVSGGGPLEEMMNSLDVLAKVATDKLEKEPKVVIKTEGVKEPKMATKSEGLKEDFSEDDSTPLKKVTKRSIQYLEEVTLQQIQSLSQKALISLFAEMSANEMSRNYTYVCHLIPDKCKQSFSSFGNESKSRSQMMAHLASHVEHLTEIQNDPDRKDKEDFIAIPITIRRRKEIEAAKKRKKSISSPLEPSSTKKRKSRAKFTAIKSSKSPDRDSGKEESDGQISDKGLTEEEPAPSTSVATNNDAKEKGKKRQSERQTKKSTPKNSSRKQVTPLETMPPKAKAVSEEPALVIQPSIVSVDDTASPNLVPKIPGKKSVKAAVTSSQIFPANTKTDRPILNEEQVILDQLNRQQPYLDHNYTTVFGKRSNVETIYLMQDNTEAVSDNENEDGETSDTGSSSSSKTQDAQGSVPILPLSHVNGDSVPMVSVEEIVSRKSGLTAAVVTATTDTSSPEMQGHGGEQPYPPMPKCTLAVQGRLPIPEEDDSESEEEDTSPRKRKKCVYPKSSRESPAEWEKRVALRCIRELKGRKKDDKMLLICKICKDKTFTAGATLMYHYRSHAGIKPFLCLICKTTFTRQHSLNYHLLIHKNESRFTCKDCGRKFRHPSHFKEHLRRHTGETPFECKECQCRFKTRNTYKRHLKTRHGKLLTAFGIHPMSREEFLKVRTKPYKNYKKSAAEAGQNQGITQTSPLQGSTPVQPRSRRMKELNPVRASTSTAMTATFYAPVVTHVPSDSDPIVHIEYGDELTSDDNEMEESADIEPAYLPIGIVER